MQRTPIRGKFCDSPEISQTKQVTGSTATSGLGHRFQAFGEWSSGFGVQAWVLGLKDFIRALNALNSEP